VKQIQQQHTWVWCKTFARQQGMWRDQAIFLPPLLPRANTHTHTQEAAKQGKKIPKGVVCYEKTKHKKQRNGDLNISQCQTVRRLQSTPTSATLSPSLPPLFFYQSKPKPKKQATVDYPPPSLSDSQKREIGRHCQTLTAIHNGTRTEANCVQENQRKNNSLARSLLRNSTHETRTHARTVGDAHTDERERR
jgi:hypothetical protein